MDKVISLIENDTGDESLAEQITNAAKSMQQSEKEALAQHVSRRKIVLDLLEKLIDRVRIKDEDKDEIDFHLESTLHSLICPMRLRGDNPKTIEHSSHDLWIIDERLSFTTAFSSDERLDKIIAEGNADRPDLLLWNLSHGLGVASEPNGSSATSTSEPINKMMVVEFKRPGRKKYPDVKDQIFKQVTDYLLKLKNGHVEDYSNKRVRISDDCIFYCYVIADIVGDLESQVATWKKTSNGQGRIQYLDGDFNGFVEVIQWQDLVNDAWMRNRATLHAAGLVRK